MLRRKRWLLGLASVVILLLMAGLWVRPRLQRHAEAVTLRKLKESYGGQVTVEGISLRLSGIELREVRLWEVDREGEPPSSWVTLDRVRLESPLWNAFADPPSIGTVTVEGATAKLRIDAAGQLQTRLPPSSEFKMPAEKVSLRDIHVVLQTQDRPPFIASEISAELLRSSRGLEASGRIGELLGAAWTFQAQADDRLEHAELQVGSEQLELNWPRLRDLPLVPSDLHPRFESLQADAQVSVKWQVIKAPGEALRHEGHVDLQSLNLEAVDKQLSVRNWTGQLRVRENRWELSELGGAFFEGELKLAGEFDADETTRLLRMEVDIADLEVARLATVVPQLPNDLTGLATGTFVFQLELGVPWTFSGSGDVNVARARWRNLPADQVELALQLDSWQYDAAASSFSTPEGTLTVHANCRDIPLEDAMEHFRSERDGLRSLQGRATADLTAMVSLASLRDPSTYRAEGAFRLSSIRWNTLDWSDLTGNWEWREGIAIIDKLEGRGSLGERLSGTVEISSDLDGETTLQLEIADIPLNAWTSAIVPFLPSGAQAAARDVTDKLQGEASAEIHLAVPSAQWQDIDTWSGEGIIRSESFTTFGMNLKQTVVRWQLQQNSLDAFDFQSHWENAIILGNAKIDFEAPFSFQVALALPDYEASRLLESTGLTVPLEWEGRVEVSGDVKGELLPLVWSAEGEGRVRNLRVPDVVIPSEIPFSLAVDAEETRLTVDHLPMWGGMVTVAGHLPWAEHLASRLVVRLEGIDSSQMEQRYFPFPEAPRGVFSGEFEVTSLEKLDSFSALGELSSSEWEMGLLRIENLAAGLHVVDGEVQVKLQGNALGGQLRLVGQSPLDLSELHPWERLDFQGTVTLENARLEDAIRRMRREDAERLRELSGQLAGDWTVAWNPTDTFPQLRGRGVLRNVRWGREELLQTAEGELQLSGTTCEFRNVSAQLGRGRITGQAELPLAGGRRGSFNLLATRIDLRRVLAPWPEVAREFEGTLDSRIRGQFDANWRGTADCQVSRARYAGTEVRGLRLPVDWSYSPERGRITARIRETTLRVAQGRAIVRGELHWGRELELQGLARLSSINLRTLLRGVTSSASVPNGRLDGRLEFSGSRIRSMNDLRGSFVGTLGDAQVLRLPVMEAIVPALGSGQLSASAFDSSDIQLSLARGEVEVDRLAFASSAVQLLVTGRATLEGRLDLDVMAHLGQINTRTPLARALRASLLVAAPPAQLALLAQANDWLTNRLIFLRVGGTFRSPSVQLRPAATVGAEAVRFFLEGATGVPSGFPQP